MNASSVITAAVLSVFVVIGFGATPATAIVCDAFKDEAYKAIGDVTDAISEAGDIFASGGIDPDPARSRKACERIRMGADSAARAKASLSTQRSKCESDWRRFQSEIADVEKTLQAVGKTVCK